MRYSPLAVPLKTPYFITACSKYSEQVGWNRQLGLVKGERNLLYIYTGAIAVFLTASLYLPLFNR